MVGQPQEISVDQLFEKQADTGFFATIEPGEKPGEVRVTPYPSGGCSCEHAIKARKSDITRLVPTGEIHATGGKRLIVVHVTFKP